MMAESHFYYVVHTFYFRYIPIAELFRLTDGRHSSILLIRVPTMLRRHKLLTRWCSENKRYTSNLFFTSLPFFFKDCYTKCTSRPEVHACILLSLLCLRYLSACWYINTQRGSIRPSCCPSIPD